MSPWMNEMTVYSSSDQEVLHLPGTPEGGVIRKTLCGIKTDTLTRQSRPVTWAGVWCIACMKAVTGVD